MSSGAPASLTPDGIDGQGEHRGERRRQRTEAAPGADYHEIVEDHGLRLEMEVEMIRAEPPLAVDAHMTGRGFEATVHNRLEETEGGTRLTVTVDTEYKGLAARLAAPVVTRHAQASLEASLATLKEISEQA